MKFVGLVGANYDQSYNRKLLEFIRRHFKIKFLEGDTWRRKFSNLLWAWDNRRDGVPGWSTSTSQDC